ncbi:MAG: Fic family protein [Chitinophagaceae bacterium]|nr:Fic family protein [Chitinophagaceae bacterium]
MRIPERPPFFDNSLEYREIINDLAKAGKLISFLDQNDQSYPYWEKWKWIAKEWGLDPVKIWNAVKIYRQNRTKIRFSEISGFQFYINSPSIVLKSLHELDLNLGGNMRSDGLIPPEQKNQYLVSSLMEEAIASSQLEGAATTRKVAREMLENNRKPRNQGEQMIVNNYEAMKWIVANKDQKFTAKNILTLHAILTKKTLVNGEEEGNFRKDDGINVVEAATGRIVYTPPSYVQLDPLMRDFCSFANDEDKGVFFIHPISKAIVIHFLIGYIHPFSDGNGRTARTLFYWYLIKKNYWLIEYMSVSRIMLSSKAQYAQAYLHTELDDNDLTYFLLYNLKCIQKALSDLRLYIEKKNEEKKRAISLLKNSSFNERQIMLINDLLLDQNQSFTVAQVQNRMSISNQTARSDLNELVEKGLLESRRIGKQAHFFATAAFEQLWKRS